jgi:hypothetical protein
MTNGNVEGMKAVRFARVVWTCLYASEGVNHHSALCSLLKTSNSNRNNNRSGGAVRRNNNNNNNSNRQIATRFVGSELKMNGHTFDLNNGNNQEQFEDTLDDVVIYTASIQKKCVAPIME